MNKSSRRPSRTRTGSRKLPTAFAPLASLIFLAFALVARAEKAEVVVLASLDSERVAASGLKIAHGRDMPDFTVTYLSGPEPNDVIGIYEGGFPSLFSSRGLRLGEVKDVIAGQRLVWICWSEEHEGQKMFGAEVLMPSRRTIVREAKSDYVEQFHLFVIRRDLKSLAEARRLMASLIRKGPPTAPPPALRLSNGPTRPDSEHH